MFRQYIRLSNSGFTLIELMIVVAIVAILVSVAYPSYHDSIRQARRASAQADLIQYTAFAERLFSEVNDYRRTAAQAVADIPNTHFYHYTVVYSTASPDPAIDFTVTATATGDQVNDSCGNMSITNTGLRNNTGPEPNCW